MDLLAVINFCLRATGCILLCVLVITVSLSERLHRRDPVFNNFLYTWILSSASGVFGSLIAFSGEDITDLRSTEAREAALVMMTMASTLNLSIHLWFTMRAGTRPSATRTKKLWTLFLVVGPYVLGLMAIPILFAQEVGLAIVGLFWVAMAIMTLVIDVLLLIKYWRYYYMVESTNLKGVLSTPFFFRLLGFALYEFLYNAFFIASLTEVAKGSDFPWELKAMKVVESTFPLVAFCVLGLHADILHLWFPCLGLRVTKPRNVGRRDDESLVEHGVSQNSEYMEQHRLISSKPEDEGRE